jgi:hypothetical protein
MDSESPHPRTELQNSGYKNLCGACGKIKSRTSSMNCNECLYLATHRKVIKIKAANERFVMLSKFESESQENIKLKYRDSSRRALFSGSREEVLEKVNRSLSKKNICRSTRHSFDK